MKPVSVALVLAIILAGSGSFFGQTAPNLENGFKAYGSYDGSHLDTVNLMNGNLMLHAPLLPDLAQRGALGVSETLYSSSKDWQAVCVPDSHSSTGERCSWQKGGAGTYFQRSPSLRVHRTLNITGSGTGTVTYSAYGYTILSADDAVHKVHGVAGTEDPNGEPMAFDAVDLSGLHLQVSNVDVNGVANDFTVTDRHGNVYQGTFGVYTGCGHAVGNVLPSPQFGPAPAPLIDDAPFGDRFCSQTGFASLVTDSNGNQIKLPVPLSQTNIDTLGRALPLATGSTVDSTGCSSAHAITAAFANTYVAPDGSTQPIKLCFAEIQIQTAFNSTGAANTPVAEAATGVQGLHFVPVVSVVLADGTHWTFDYDSYGEVTYIGLPTGGSISYTWTTINFINCDLLNFTKVSRAVATRTLNDGLGHSSIWHYNWGTASSSSLTNVVTDPLGNDTVHVFTVLNPANAPSPGCSFYETSTITYQGAAGANQPLQRVDTTYSSTPLLSDTANTGEIGNVFATDVLITLYPSGKVKKVHKEPDGGLGAGLPIFGNAVRELEYDWGQGSPGALLRETDTVYQWQKNSAYLTAHMLDLPASTVVIDAVAANNTRSNCPINAAGGTAACIAETDYSYDEAAYLVSAGITTQHVAPPAAVRGNQSTVSRWLNTANGFVSSHTRWYDTGEPYQKIDALGHTTTLSYDSAYVGAYVTETCSPTTSPGSVTHCVSGTYDFTTGLLTSLTNENATSQASGNTPGDSAHTSNFSYDLMFRVTSGQAPPDPDNSSARASTSFIYSTSSVPWAVNHTKSVTNALSDSATSFFDGLGRGYKSQHALPNGTGTVDTTFDVAGRVATVSNPYFTTSDPTYGITQTIYDALDRPLLAQKQDGSFSTVTYQDNCTVAEDEAGKARRTCTDGLGRLVEVEEPGDASAPAATDTSTVSTQATAMVNIGGGDQVLPPPPPPKCPKPPLPCDQTPVDPTYDMGSVSLTVNGHITSAGYGQGDTASSVALRLANAINADGAAVVTASASGTQITLTARTAGESGDYTVSFSTSWDTADFSGASFSGLVANYRLLGGADLNQFAHTYLTLYQYDALGNLLCVEQHGNVAPGTAGATGCSSSPSNDATSPWRVRRFTYDSLSRLLTAKNPESGAITYLYDQDGELLQKTSPAPNQTGTATQTVSYCYDELHRVTGKGYGAQSCPLATPVVSYAYDSGANAKGHLTSMTDQAGTATYGYDILERLTTETRSLTGANNAAISKNISYSYNLDGSVKTLTYPSGKVISYAPDSAGRMLSAIDSGSGTNYVTGATYGPDSALTGFISGNSGTFAGIANSFSYNKRLQPCRMTASTGALPANCADADSTHRGNVYDITYDFHVGNGASGTDNGNVWGITNYKDTTRSQTFTYDALNRLISAQNTGTDCTVNVLGGNKKFWGNTYGYDAWGNLLNKTKITTACAGEGLSVTADAQNRIHSSAPDYQYDAAGNMTFNATPPAQTYTYDQENRLTGAAGYTYTYDGDGNRVRKSNGTLAASGTLYWSMTPGVVAETDLAGTLKSEYIFFDGERVARRDGATGTGGVFYYFSDHLKTASVITDSAGAIKAESDYYPWGGELKFVDNDANDYKFTGKKRDIETGLDYFGARYYSNGLGRWVSADWSPTPLPVPYADFGDPQSLNLYGFVGGNPASKADPDGHHDIEGMLIIFFNDLVVTRGPQAVKDAFNDVVGVLKQATTPPSQPTPPAGFVPPCTCGPQPVPMPMEEEKGGNNNSKSINQQEQGRDAQGKFTSKQPGQSAPGSAAEKKGLDSVGAVKNKSEILNGTKRDGTIPETGQHVEVKSGEVINRTEQLQSMGQAAVDNTGQPLKVVTTNPNARVSGPAQKDPNLQTEPMKKK